MNVLRKIAVLALFAVTIIGAQPSKLARFIESFRLDYSVELGLMPGGSKAMLYDLNGLNLFAKQYNLSWKAYSSLDFELTFKKLVFVSAGTTSYQVSNVGNIVNFCPVRMDYPIGVGFRFKKIELGYFYSCFHPVIPEMYIPPLPKIDAAISRIYIKYRSGGVGQ